MAAIERRLLRQILLQLRIIKSPKPKITYLKRIRFQIGSETALNIPDGWEWKFLSGVMRHLTGAGLATVINFKGVQVSPLGTFQIARYEVADASASGYYPLDFKNQTILLRKNDTVGFAFDANEYCDCCFEVYQI